MTFWTIYRSPLIIGGNLPENRAIELKLFTNKEVLDVNQHGQNPKELYFNKDNNMAWYSQIPGSKDVYVALFNLSDKANPVKVDFAALGLKGKINVRDLWQKHNAGAYQDSYQQTINRHGAALLRLSVAGGKAN